MPVYSCIQVGNYSATRSAGITNIADVTYCGVSEIDIDGLWIDRYEESGCLSAGSFGLQYSVLKIAEGSKEMTIELWTWATPNGWKVSIMLEELLEAGVELPPIEVRHVDIMNRQQFSDEFTDIVPNQKIPGLVHGDTKLMESCAILLYLGETFPSSLLPQDDSRWEVIHWLFWQAAGVGPIFGNKLSYTRYMDDVPAEQKAHPLERFNNEAQRLLRVLDRQLEGKDYICGDYSVADIAAWPWVRGWKWSKVDVTGHANVMAWIDRVRARPAVERGITYGFPAEELDQWSEETKQRYAKGGASIASNDSIADS